MRCCYGIKNCHKNMNKWILVFIFSFGINLIWENLHHFLYIHYKGGVITEFILIRAALVDALIISGLVFVLRLSYFLKRYPWLLIFGGVMVSIVIEYWALSNNRWEYKNIMPIIPFLNTGLTPTIQLGLISYFTYKLFFRKKVL
jgi:hypothetical protein